MFRLTLNGQWKFRQIGNENWFEAEVPGSVFHDLLATGKIEDPFYRENEYKAREIASRDYEYFKEFSADSELLDKDRIILYCEGLDTLADIYLNDVLIGSVNNMHRIYEFDIKSLLIAGKNSLRVVFHSPIKYIEEKNAENPLWGSGDAIAGFPHIRKGHSMFGWDWGPQIPDSGIWRSIAIIGSGADRLEDIYITQRHQKGRVTLDIRARIACVPKDEHVIRVVLTAPDGKTIVQQVRPVGKEEHILLQIDRPELWWPNGYGAQPLYDVGIELRRAGDLLDERSYRVGLRTIGVRREKDSWGESFEFVINGVSIFAMGADYIPEDSLLPRCSRERTEKLIKSCVAANFNCLRIWGGGYYPEDYLYDLCDQYGLLVWQDFMFACAEYELTDEFAENIVTEARDNIIRLRHHASLAIWCGNNEMETAWVNWGFPKTQKRRGHYTMMFEELLPRAVSEFDPETFYWPSSPSSGGGFDDPNDENRGDVHYWEVWHGLKPFTDYRKFHFRFVSEFGFQSFPGRKTVESFTLPEDRNIFSYVMENHQKNGSANGKILFYLSDNFKYPKDFDSLLYTSQILQAEAIKYGVEHWRRNRGRCMGAIYWQLNDCWPVASWASIDYFGRWKALHYFARRFFAPVILTACEEECSAALHVSNESMREFSGELRWQLRDARSNILKSGSASVVALPLSSKEICDLDFSAELSDRQTRRETYLEYTLWHGEEYISGGTLLFVKNKHFEFVRPEIAVTVEESDDQFLIRLCSKAYARYVGLDLTFADCIFEDNYFDLSAGDTKLIRVKKDDLSMSLTAEEFKSQLQIRSIVDLA